MEKVKQKALTFDDVLLLPRYSDFVPSEASTHTRLTKNINIKVPLISAAMDTVTESRMAIALAEVGGIGIIHKNNSIEDQIAQVKIVKKYESGVVRDPITIETNKSIGELIQLTTELNISGMPVVDNGKLKGIVTSRDFRYADNMNALVSSIMTPFEKLINGLVTMKDIEKSAEHPDATKDDSGSLMVGAALGTGPNTLKRAKALSEAGVDVFVIDSAHAHSKNVIETVKMIKKEFPSIDLIAGNVATSDGAMELVKAGADAIKVGMGPGSICTTRIIAGIGVPQISAILDIKEALKDLSVGIIADGGIQKNHLNSLEDIGVDIAVQGGAIFG